MESSDSFTVSFSARFQDVSTDTSGKCFNTRRTVPLEACRLSTANLVESLVHFSFMMWKRSRMWMALLHLSVQFD